MSNNDNAIDEVIKEIAIQHGIAVGRDDPIMIIMTIYKMLLANNDKHQKASLEHFKSELELVAQRWSQEASTRADLTINRAVDAGKREMQDAVKGVTEAAKEGINAEIDASVRKLNSALNGAQRVANLNIIAAGCSILAATIVLFMMW